MPWTKSIIGFHALAILDGIGSNRPYARGSRCNIVAMVLPGWRVQISTSSLDRLSLGFFCVRSSCEDFCWGGKVSTKYLGCLADMGN